MPQKWWVLTAVACGTFMATLDSSIVNIALPTLKKSFETDLHQVKWIVIIYLFFITCLLLPFGRLADLYGRKRIFQIGFCIFTLGSAFCGLSQNLLWLLCARAIQGIGASMLMSNGPALITAAFPAGERGKALGTLAMVVSSGLISGPSIGGFLITYLGWQSIFLVNLPIGILGFVLVQRFVHKQKLKKKSPPFDWAGGIVQTGFLITFMVSIDPPFSEADVGTNFFFWVRFLSGVSSLYLGFLFIRLESRSSFPLLDVTIFKNKTFWTSNLAGFLTFLSYSILTVLMPFFLEEVLHYSPSKAGLFMTVIPLAILIIAPISGRLSDRFGSQELSFAGSLIGAVGLFGMAGVFGKGLYPETGSLGIILGLGSIGLGTGLFQSPNNNSIMSSVPPEKLGIAAAFMATVRNLGIATGTGLSTLIFSWRQNYTGNFTHALHFTLFFAGLVSLAAMIASLGKQRGPNPHPTRKTDL